MLILEIALVILNFYHIRFSFRYGPPGTANWRIEWTRLSASWVALDLQLTIQSWLQLTFGPPMSVCFFLMNKHLLGRILLLGFIMIAQLTCYGLGNVLANLMVLTLNSWEELLIHLVSRCIYSVPCPCPWYVWLSCYFALIIKITFHLIYFSFCIKLLLMWLSKLLLHMIDPGK
jgi:hypothetical protein